MGTDLLIDEEYGIIQRVDESPPPSGFPPFYRFRARWQTLMNSNGEPLMGKVSGGGGYSVDRARARLSAIGEAIERYCSAILSQHHLSKCPKIIDSSLFSDTYLEPQFFTSVNVKFRWRTGEFQWTEMRRALTHGFPLLALANIAHFEHANTAVDFAAHTVLLVGFDETSNTVLVADTHYPGLQHVKLSSLARAMDTEAFPPLFSGNAWKEVGRVSMLSIEVAIRTALKTNINLMLRPYMEQMGLSAIRKLALSLPTWDQFPRCWNVPLRFYDFSEKRGSGGGAFRYLYAQFLNEASRYLPCLQDIEATTRYTKIADMWRDMARLVYGAARHQDTLSFVKEASIADRIADLEGGVLRDIEKVI